MRRHDAVMWLVALVAAALLTLLLWAFGARLGAALTGGVAVATAVVVGVLGAGGRAGPPRPGTRS